VHRFERFGEVVAAAAGGAERAENGSAESGGVAPLPAASAIASQAPSRFSTKSNQSP
jgi:hypothetical protein